MQWVDVKGPHIFLAGVVLVVILSACTTRPTPSPSVPGPSTPGTPPSPTTLPSWVSGQPGTATLEAPGGTGPFRCSLKPGSSLPAGFALTPNCQLSGQAPALAPGSTKSVAPPFIVTVTDSSNPPRTVDLVLSIPVVESAPRLTPVTTGRCTTGKYCYVEVARAEGGTWPYSFKSSTFREGTPPLGMSVDLNGGLSGTPSRKGVYNFEVCVVDNVGASDCKPTSVTVDLGPNVTVDRKSCTLRSSTPAGNVYRAEWGGTATGEEGASIGVGEKWGLYSDTADLSCGSWTKTVKGSSEGKCTRSSGQPETTTWSISYTIDPTWGYGRTTGPYRHSDTVGLLVDQYFYVRDPSVTVELICQ